MKSKISPSNYLVRNLLILLFNMGLILGLHDLLFYEIDTTSVLTMVIVVHVIIGLLFYNKYTFIGSLFLAFIVLSISALSKESDGYNLYYYFSQFIGSIISAFSTRQFPYYYQGAMLTLLTLSIGTLLYILEFYVKRFHPGILIILGLALYMVPGLLNITMGTLGFALMILASVVYLFMHQYRFNESRFLQYSTGIVLAFIIAMATISSTNVYLDKKPDGLSFIRDAITYVKDKKWLETDLPGGGVVVYDENRSNFEGLEDQDETIVMSITSSSAKYLRGRTRKQYEDGFWLRVDYDNNLVPFDDITSANLMQNMQGLHYLHSVSQGIPVENMTPPSDLYAPEGAPVIREKLTINYDNLISFILFLPYGYNRVAPIVLSDQPSFNLRDDGTVSSRFPLKKGMVYEMDLTTIDYDTPQLHQYLRQSYLGLDKDLQSNKSLEYSTSPDASNKIFLNIPDNIPESVWNLTEEITSTYTTNYDKVRAIEKHLANNYTYNLQIDSVPDDKELISYFLFDSKEGYCTYYATSMTMMVRMLGIPSRYVTGYRIPNRPRGGDSYGSSQVYFEDEEGLITDNDIIHVRQLNAHAWVEVYFEGFGWVPFEPTAPFYTAYTNALRMPASDPANIPQPKTDAQKGTSSFSLAFLLPYIRSILKFILWILLLTWPFLYKMARVLLFKTSDNQNKAITLYRQIAFSYGLLGLPLKKNETAHEYSTRIHHEMWYLNSRFSNITAVFEKARYSSQPITDDELALLYDYLEYISRLVKKESAFKHIQLWFYY